MFKLDNKIGLGLASLGRPGYINIGHSSDLGSDISKNSMRSHCHEVLSHAYKRGIRYFDAARVYGDAEEFLSSWIRAQKQFDGFVGSKWGYEYLANWEVQADQHERKDHSVEFLKQQWVETRLNLGKSIDLYHIHSVNSESKVLDDINVLKELETIKKNGIEIGISTSGPDQEKTINDLLIKNEKLNLFSYLQTTINIFDQSCISILKEVSKKKINVIAKELKKEIANDPRYADDIDTLLSQVKRCGEILRKLSKGKIESDAYVSNISLQDLLFEITKSFNELTETTPQVSKDN